MLGKSSDDVLLLPRRISGESQNSARMKKTTFFWQVHILSVYFFTIIISRIVNSFWCEKAVFYNSFPKSISVKRNQLRLQFDLWWKKIWGGHWKEKGKGTKTYSLPNLIELHSLFIEEQNSSWPMLICSSDEVSMLYWIFQCKCLHFMNWVLAKKKGISRKNPAKS